MEPVDRTNYSLQLQYVLRVADNDVTALAKAEQSYGDSWKKRGGTGAMMMLARKWDRLENQVSAVNWDIFQAIQEDTRSEGIIDDIRDLRRYLLLVESEILMQGVIDHEHPDLFQEGN